MEKLLSSIYYDIDNPASYGGVAKLYKAALARQPSITRDDVKSWLSSQNAYTLHKPARRHWKREPTVVSKIDEQFQADLVEMQEFAAENRGFRYILTAIDILSKY